MADIEIKGLDDDLYEKIVKSAKVRDISVNQQVLNIIKKFFTFDMDGPAHTAAVSQTQVSSDSGSEPVKSTDAIVSDICTSRISKIRFDTGDGITDLGTPDASTN